MRWLMRRRLRNDEHGATTVLVAILVSVFMLGLGAIVTDVGSWYTERTQLQNGADGGALAVAESCGKGACDVTVAGQYAGSGTNGNNNAQLSTNGAVTTGFPCGNSAAGISPGLPACPAGTEDGSYCPLPPNPPVNYVDVHVNTSTSVQPILGQALNGGAKTIIACAQAVWGPSSTCGSCAALTISACEWLENTNNGQNFASPYPPYPPSFLDSLAARQAAGINFTAATDPDKETTKDAGTVTHAYGNETVITTHGLGNNPCAAGHPGWDAPGLFGWLSQTSCTFAIASGEYPGTPGNSPPDCGAVFATSQATQKPIYLPVYSGIDPVTKEYILDGFAAFVVTGWDVHNGGGGWTGSKISDSVISGTGPGGDAVTPAKDRQYCGSPYTSNSGNSDICVFGYFTQALISASELPGGGGGNNLGAVAVRLSG